MESIHNFEIVGEVLFRPSGNAGFPPVPCVIVTTIAFEFEDGSVRFIELATGHGTYRFPHWFASISPEPGDSRRVQVAVPRVAYEEILRTGRPLLRDYVIGGDAQTQFRLTEHLGDWSGMVQTPIAAVKIDHEWVFPLPDGITR